MNILIVFLLLYELLIPKVRPKIVIIDEEKVPFVKKVKDEDMQVDTLLTTLYYFGNVSVYLNRVAKESLILYEQEYNRLPIKLKQSIKRITITSQSLNQICGISSEYRVKGCAFSDTYDLYLDAQYRYGDLLHESIHLYSYQKNRVFSKTFTNIYAIEGNNISVQTGNVHTIYEYFVSAYLLFMENPIALLAICPQTYHYFGTF